VTVAVSDKVPVEHNKVGDAVTVEVAPAVTVREAVVAVLVPHPLVAVRV
jgi:hypothetical protein